MHNQQVEQGIKEPTIQTKKYSQLVKGAPSRLLDFACITTINKSITIFEALGKENGSLRKKLQMMNTIHC
jgi:hypothetical protein